MRKTLLLLLFAFVATIMNAETVNYSTELLYNSSGDGLVVVRQITHPDGSVTIGDYQGDIVIPEMVNGMKVVAIDAGAFKDCTDLTGISIPATVTYSGPEAFYGCTSLKKLRLEDSDKEIIFIATDDPWVTVRYWEFAALEEVYVGRNYRCQFKSGEPGSSFGEPFSHHPSIKSVTFGDKVTRINEGAFGWIHTLESVSLGNDLITIEKDAFQCSDQLASRLHFPKSLKFIGEYAFYGTSIPACILLFRKNRTTRDVLFVDASGKDENGAPRFEKGKNQNRLSEKHVEDILRAVSERRNVPRFAHVAPPDELERNGWNLNIPRYVDTFEEEEPIDLRAVQADIARLKAEAAAAEAELDGYLKELGLA